MIEILSSSSLGLMTIIILGSDQILCDIVINGSLTKVDRITGLLDNSLSILRLLHQHVYWLHLTLEPLQCAVQVKSLRVDSVDSLSLIELILSGAHLDFREVG